MVLATIQLKYVALSWFSYSPSTAHLQSVIQGFPVLIIYAMCILVAARLIFTAAIMQAQNTSSTFYGCTIIFVSTLLKYNNKMLIEWLHISIHAIDNNNIPPVA